MFNKFLSLVVISAISASAFGLAGGKEGKTEAKAEADRQAQIKELLVKNRLAKTFKADALAAIEKNASKKENSGLAKLMLESRIAKELSADTIEKLFASSANQIEASEMLISPSFKGEAWAEAAGVANLRLLAENKSRQVTAKEQIEIFNEVKSGSEVATVKAYVSLVNKTAKHLAKGDSAENSSLLATLEVMQENILKNANQSVNFTLADVSTLPADMVKRAKDVQDDLRKQCKNL